MTLTSNIIKKNILVLLSLAGLVACGGGAGTEENSPAGAVTTNFLRVRGVLR